MFSVVKMRLMSKSGDINNGTEPDPYSLAPYPTLHPKYPIAYQTMKLQQMLNTQV